MSLLNDGIFQARSQAGAWERANEQQLHYFITSINDEFVKTLFFCYPVIPVQAGMNCAGNFFETIMNG